MRGYREWINILWMCNLFPFPQKLVTWLNSSLCSKLLLLKFLRLLLNKSQYLCSKVYFSNLLNKRTLFFDTALKNSKWEN